MRIIECHIENFGGLSDRHFRFTDGLNVINEKNGTGKSTLAAFIKVMFFGFANEGKRSDIENERKRFKPWQGGVYGGQLTFETEGKKYVISRTFGAKDKDDIFVLYDADTMLESSDYSVNIGEELFKIDHDSFCRTVYIGGSDCETAATDSINAKLGNLAENTDDINNYETVKKALADLLNSMSPRRKTGDIFKLNSEIGSLRESVRQGEAIDSSITDLTAMRDAEKSRRNELKEKQNEIQLKLNELSGYKDIQGKRDRYADLCTQYEARRTRYDEEKAYFPASLPDEQELDRCMADVAQLSVYKKSLEIYVMSDEENNEYRELEKMFSDGVSETDSVSGVKLKAAEDESRIDSVIAAWGIRNEKKNLISTKKASFGTLQNIAEQNSREKTNTTAKDNSVIYIIAGVILAALLIAGIFISKLLFVAAVAVAAVMIYGIVRGKKNYSKALDGFELDKGDYASNDELSALRAEIEADEEYIRKTENDVMLFMTENGMEYDEPYVTGRLYELKSMTREAAADKESKVKRYMDYTDKRLRYKDAYDKYNEVMTRLNDFAEESLITLSDEPANQLRDMRDHMIRCRESGIELENAAKLKQEFEAANDMPAILSSRMSDNNTNESLEELNEELKRCTEQLGRAIENISDYNTRLDKAYSERDAVSEDEAKLSEAEERVSDMIRKYNVITKTQEYLEKAKETFTAKYMSPIMEGFDRYYSLLAHEDAGDYQINANIEITAREAGILRDVRLLSMGYRSLIGVCMRMALVDAMYSDERPFVVFDDPFVSLDADKVRGGMDFLDNISEKYQVIYFTCHESRM